MKNPNKIKQKSGSISKRQLLEKIKVCFPSDTVEVTRNNIIIKTNFNCFTYANLKGLFELSKRYGFTFAVHDGNISFGKMNILISFKGE
jgi:hypothetical protein